MQKAVIREHHRQIPIEPYQWVLVNGDAFNVPQPDFLFLGEPPAEGELEDEMVYVFRKPTKDSGFSPIKLRVATSWKSRLSTFPTSSPTTDSWGIM